MKNYKTEYKDYSNSVAIMISTDRLIFMEKSQVRARMVEYSKLYKELHIIVFSTKKIEPITISSGCKIYSTNSLLRLNYVKDACSLGKAILKGISKEMPLLVTCQDPFETALAGKYVANLRKDSDLLIQIHTEMFSPYFVSNCIGIKDATLNRIRLFISRFTLPHAQVIRVVSRKIADSLVDRGFAQAKIILKPIDINIAYTKSLVPSFDLRKKFPQFGKIILVVSRLEYEKNVGMAIDAMKYIYEKDKSYGMVVVGSGACIDSLKKQAYKINEGKNVVFEGWQTDLSPYYAGADVLLVTSWYEGYGMVFKEAQASGLKIVSTNVGIAQEVDAVIADWNAKDIAEKVVQTLQ
jgi:glycosyltransferase involved in cell wall biosynthesis